MNRLSRRSGNMMMRRFILSPSLLNKGSVTPSTSVSTFPASSLNSLSTTILYRSFSASPQPPLTPQHNHNKNKSLNKVNTPDLSHSASATDPTHQTQTHAQAQAQDEEATAEKIKSKIRSWKHNSSHEQTMSIYKAFYEAQINDIPLDSRDYLLGLSMCVHSKTAKSSKSVSGTPSGTGTAAANNNTGVVCDKKLPFWLFEQLKNTDKVIPIEGFEKVLKFCQQRRLVDEAIEIIELYRTSGYQLTETILTTIISILVKGPLHKQNLRLIQNYYDIYRDMNKSLGWRLHAPLYYEIAVAFCKNKQENLCLNVLEDMINAHHEPISQFCDEVLKAALFHKETKVLRVLSSWYSNFFQVRLEYGILSQMLQAASAAGDGQLAIVAFQMFAKNGYYPSKSTYLCLIHALLKSDDLISAIEALQEFDSSGIQMTTEEYRSLKQAIVTNLTVPTQITKAQKNTRLDDLYYALVDQKQTGGHVVPMVVLDAILESAGKLESVDRAFATFKDYQQVFQIQPTTETYNSLLLSATWQRDMNVNTLLSILQDMDSKAESEGINCAPNSLSYSILIEALIAKREKAILGNVVAHMDSLSILPMGRASRRLLGYLRKNHVQNIPSGFVEKLESTTLQL